MKLALKDLQSKRQWRAATGLEEHQFKKLLKLYKVKQYSKKEKTLLLDGTEQRIQRPGDNEAQKMMYSGKKRTSNKNINDK